MLRLGDANPVAAGDVEHRVGAAQGIGQGLDRCRREVDLDQGAAELDAEATAAELVKLWQERVGLMRELMNARATRARYVGL